jgi:hypothetical protein
MQTECSADLFGFARVEGHAVVAGFDGGKITSDAGALLLGATDRAIRLSEPRVPHHSAERIVRRVA